MFILSTNLQQHKKEKLRNVNHKLFKGKKDTINEQLKCSLISVVINVFSFLIIDNTDSLQIISVCFF